MTRGDGHTHRRLGTHEAAKQAHFIAAPLLAATALSLAGVVGGADERFRWPGITLLLLVTTAMTLIASIQLSYHAFHFRFTRADLDADLALRGYPGHDDDERNATVKKAQEYYEYRLGLANACFNWGTLMLGAGIAASLVPEPDGRQLWWRTAAAVLVLVCTVLDGLWLLYLRTD
ncbi:hypothetical protein [Streptomyces shaanxiensis]